MHTWWASDRLPLTAPASVLVVDNDPSKRLAIRATLDPLGCRIVEAESGVAALRCLMVEDFAVVLLDVRMPEMDGFDTASIIRLRPSSEMTPIIFITAYAADELGADKYAHGAVDFLFTPFEPDALRAKVSVFANLFLRAETLAEQARAVRASADQLRLLTEAAPIGIFQTDADNNYVYTNPGWSEITGMGPAEALGVKWDVILDPEDRDEGYQKRVVMVDNGTVASLRFTITSAEGPPRVVLLTSRSILSAEGISSGWVGTLADISAEVGAAAAMAEARDEATEASRLKSDFLANMSHEIRTPMNGVLGMAELLLETRLDPEQHEYAQTVRSSGEALLTVINDILDFSKVETGMLELENVSFSVSAVTDDVVGLLSSSASGNGVILSAEVDTSVPEAVHGDPGRLRQVLTNLVGNAIKFSDHGQIAVRVRAAPQSSRPMLRFEVSDTGVGIDARKLAMIFEPFVQGDTSTSRTYGGTGLGLAISNQLVTLMGGEMGVSSTLGEGSTFWFTVSTAVAADPPGPTDRPGPGVAGVAAEHTQPVALDAAPMGAADRPQRERAAEPAAAAPPPTVPGRVSHGRLLVAEDNLVNLKVAVAMLTSAGYDVEIAHNGLEAVEASMVTDYDAILMDCQMPKLDGYEATEAIRAREGSTRHTPIIALTAGARPQDRERCLAHSMDDYLSKPFNKKSLLEVVRGSLRNSSAVHSPT
jgi:PAS domain S-box-containing protein